ncbi:MAG: hypothetical protein ABI536_01350 [Gallionella sp.]
MPEYRRADIPGATYFFTVITYRRQALLTDPRCRASLRIAIDKVRLEMPFKIVAVNARSPACSLAASAK